MTNWNAHYPDSPKTNELGIAATAVSSGPLRNPSVGECTAYVVRGVVAVLTARNPVGRDILADRLTRLGYRRVSPPGPTPTAATPRPD